jgi:nitrite reductase (NADH) large subunit
MARRFVIVGSGAAGIAAAESLRQRDSAAKIALVTHDPDGYYSRPGLAYLLTGHLPENQLFPLSARELSDLHIEFIHDRAVSIDSDAHRLGLLRHDPLHYDRLLLAVGAQASMPVVEGVELQGVVKLDTLQDARIIAKLARRARRAVVVGGGITAVELVEGLAARGVETHYFLRRERYWPGVLDEHESRLVEHCLTQEGVQIHHHTELRRILGRRGRVSGVETAAGVTLACQMVAFAIGIRPRQNLARSGGVEVQRGILVDEQLRTSGTDIYAAGDAAQVFDPVRNEHLLDSLWWPAVEQGRIAGINMAGASQEYRKPLAMNVTRIGGLTTTLIGALGAGQADDDLLSIARGDSEAWRRAPHAFAVEREREANRIRLLLDETNIIGALVMGDQTLSYPLQDLILQRVDIQPIRGRLLAASEPVGELLTDFWLNWKENEGALES